MSAKRKDSKGRILRKGEVQRPDGKYMYRYVDALGVRRTVYSWRLVSTDQGPDGKKDQIALRDMEKEIRRDIDDGISTADAGRTTVNDLFDSFMALRTDLKTTTRRNYICLYNKHIRNTIGPRTLKDVKSSNIQRLYMRMVQELNLKTGTVQSIHSILYQMFENAVMDDIIRRNPTASVLKSLRRIMSYEQEKRHALTEIEQERFVDFVHSTRQYQRWAPLFTVLLGTGMRIGEALGLRWSDCDFEENTISVNHTLLYKDNEAGKYEYRISEPKTRAGVRVIPMLDDVRSTLLAEKKKRRGRGKDKFTVDGYTDFIFLNRENKVFTPGAVFDAIQNITAAYNREEVLKAEAEKRDPVYLPKFSAHILRHTFCTRFCENEPNIMIVQDVIGRENSRTTMDVYNEATAVKKRASFRSLEGKMKVV